jgi:hypothetical protein
MGWFFNSLTTAYMNMSCNLPADISRLVACTKDPATSANVMFSNHLAKRCNLCTTSARLLGVDYR